MRFHIGPPPLEIEFHPAEEGWTPLREPTPLMLNVLAVPFGVAAAVLLALAWGTQAMIHVESGDSELGRLVFAGLLLVALAVSLLGVVAVHELVHAVGYPAFGLTRSTVIGVWPSRLLFYAGYLRSLPRNRWLFVYLLPFLVLSIVPLVLYHALGFESAWLYFLSLLNGLFSGGDLLFFVLILLQVPRRAIMQNHGWSTWWRGLD
jgi:hypothetical protein